MASFQRWLDRFLDEKEIDLDTSIEVEGPSGVNVLSYADVVHAMKVTTAAEQKSLKTLLVKADFVNHDIRKVLAHLAQAIAI